MKALHFFRHGGIENLRFGLIEAPGVAAGHVRVRVRACALNHLDLWVLQGWPGLRIDLLHIGGADVAGEIDLVGEEVSGWKPGDKVVVNPGIVTTEDEWTRRGEDSVSPHYRILGERLRGGFAEYVSIPARNILTMPEGLNFVEAAAPLLTGLTAWRMLVKRAQLRAGETVLVVGAGGGVNSFSIILANAMGAEVIALTSSEEKAEKARELGAEHVINYRAVPDWSRQVRTITHGRGVDVIVDNVGAQTFSQSIHTACRGGRIVTVGNTSGPRVTYDNRLIFAKQLSILGSTMGSAQDFKDVMGFIWLRKIKPIVHKTLPLKDGKKAYQTLKDGSQFGKIVLVPE